MRKRCSVFRVSVVAVAVAAVLFSLTPFAPRMLAAQSQTGKRGLTVRQNKPVGEWPNASKRWALVIGIDEYRDKEIGRLNGAANDARTLVDSLVRYAGFPSDQVILLSTDQPSERQPTRSVILKYLSNLRGLVPKDGLLLVAFAGHGIGREGRAYLLPSDAVASNDIALLEDTAIGVERLKELIKATDVGQVVLILDACRNDPTAGRSNSDNLMTEAYTRGFNFDIRNREVSAFVTLYATEVGHRAYEYAEKKQGYFTWALVEALRGEAANAKGEVTLSSLVKFLQDSVPRYVRRDLGPDKLQRPFAIVEGYKAEELVIAVTAPKAAAQPADKASNVSIATDSTLDPLTTEDLSYWNRIKNSKNPEDFKTYVAKYPNGLFADLAKLRVQPAKATTPPPIAEEEKIKIEKRGVNSLVAQPKGLQVAQVANNGVLFVLTDPPTANVIIKNKGANVKQGQSKDGEFRAELPPGVYDVEISSAKYVPFSGKASIKIEKPEILRAGLTPTTGAILIGPVEPDAEIMIDGQKVTSLNVKKSENQIELRDIAAGFHTMRIIHPTTVDWEREKIEVQGGATTYIAPKFKPAIVNLIVKSEPGAEIYIDGSYKGRVEESGKTGILELKPGRYTIKAVKDEFSSAEQTKVFAGADAVLELKLNRVSFSPEFSDYFTEGAKFWTMPGGWQVSRGKMTVRGAGVGYLRDKNYKDFKAEFDIRFANGRGAAWVLRSRDEQNYYLFQLSGPNGKTPNTFRTYISQNGQLKLLKSDAVVENLSQPEDSFHIIVEAKGPTIRHWIQVKSAPKAEGPQPMSTLADATFSHGSIGFSTLDDEEITVFFINVTPLN